jgi:hypothetical protein
MTLALALALSLGWAGPALADILADTLFFRE